MSLIVNPNLFQGEYAKGVTHASVLGSNDIEAGLFRKVMAIEDKAIFRVRDNAPTLTAGSLCNWGTPQDVLIREQELSVATYRVSEQICKDDLKGTAWAMDLNAGVWNKQIPAEFIQQTIEYQAGKLAQALERVRWAGSVAGGAAEDGIVTKIIALGVNALPANPNGYFRPAYVAGAAVAPATVVAEIQKALNLVPADVRYQSNNKIVVSPQVASAYQQAVGANVAFAQWNMGMVTPLDRPNITFIGTFGVTGIPMYVAQGLAALPETILITRMSDDMDGNLVLATDADADFQTIMVHDYQAVDPFNFNVRFGWAVRHGVDVLKGNEVVLYHA